MTKEQKLYDYLKAKHIGQENAVHSKKLEKHFDICPRTVRTYVNNLRKSGVPICSDDSGYWIAKTPKEASKTVKRLGNYAGETMIQEQITDGEINNARTGIAFGAIQMRSVTTITEESLHITVKVG